MVLLCEAVRTVDIIRLASALGEAGGGEHFLDRIWEFVGHGISFLGKLKFDNEKGLTCPLTDAEPVQLSPNCKRPQNLMPRPLLCMTSQ